MIPNVGQRKITLAKAPDLPGVFDVIDSGCFFMNGELVGPGSWIKESELSQLQEQGQSFEIVRGM